MNKIVIYKADASAINGIQHIAHTTWPVAYGEILTAAQIKYMLDAWYNTEELNKQFEEGQQFYLAKLGDDLVGYGAFGFKEAPHIYKLHKLYVMPGTQGTGAGKALLERIFSEAKYLGATLLVLNVNRNNKAWMFYKKMGFEILQEYDLDIGSGYWMNDYIMQKSYNLFSCKLHPDFDGHDLQIY